MHERREPGTQTVEFRAETWQYPDSELMQQAAIRVFREVFTEVGAAPTLSAATITVVLNGSSSWNPVMNEYNANATATVFPGYEGAFRQIGNRMLADGGLLAKLKGKQEARAYRIRMGSESPRHLWAAGG
jgi:hypothetical protein